MSKNKKVKNVNGNKEGMLTGEQVLKLLPESEKFALEIIMKASSLGSSRDALFMEAYALSKAIIYLKHIAWSKGWDITNVVENFAPLFEQEAMCMLDDIRKERARNNK